MKGFIRKSVTAWCVTGGLFAVGCDAYRDLVDPCWPERYSYAATREVLDGMAPQVQNGHILDQTMWNCYFERGSARLTPGGMEKLVYLVRRRPHPDPIIYLQTAQEGTDLHYDPSLPEAFSQARRKLDLERIESIQRFLSAETANRGLAFDVQIHDPADPGMGAINMRGATPVAGGTTMQVYSTTFTGTLPGAGGAGGGGGGGR